MHPGARGSRGASCAAHLRENVAAVSLALTAEDVEELDVIPA